MLASLLLLAGCAGMSAEAPSADWFDGAVLEIRKPLPVAAEQQSLRFQYGRASDQRHATVWDEQCRLILARPPAQAGTVGPGRYRVLRVTRTDLPLSRYSFVRSTRLWLQTLEGTPVEALECERAYEHPMSLRAEDPLELTPDAVRQALGASFRLVSPRASDL
ncbi:MAG: hypothetical protein D6717_05000 [Gammaproteobacteria bacterium]|nr:MAG: hypothetical protein D6717_05000 [Gammaproteobacteria bacterium]